MAKSEDFGIDAGLVKSVFQRVADICGGDILAACEECGEPPVIDREGLYDYLEIHGGPDGKVVGDFLDQYLKDHSLKQLDKLLTKMGVPKTWR